MSLRTFINKVTGKKDQPHAPTQGGDDPMIEIQKEQEKAELARRIKHRKRSNAKAFKSPYRRKATGGGTKGARGRCKGPFDYSTPTPAKRIGTRLRDIKLAKFKQRQSERREQLAPVAG